MAAKLNYEVNGGPIPAPIKAILKIEKQRIFIGRLRMSTLSFFFKTSVN